MPKVNSQGPPVPCVIALKNNPKERLGFESFPEDIGEGYTVTWAHFDAVRTSDRVSAVYQGGKYSDFSINLVFVAGLFTTTRLYGRRNLEPGQLRGSVEINDELKFMEQKVRWLQALAFPRPLQRRGSNARAFGISGDPPRVLVTIGQFMTIEGVVSSWNTRWKPPFHPESVRPYVGTVDITIKRIGTFYPSWYDIVNVASERVPPKNNFASLRDTQNKVLKQVWEAVNPFKESEG